MVNKIKRYYQYIAEWFWYNSPIYIMWPAIWKCWKEWWKARQYFLFPSIKYSWHKSKWVYGSDAKIFSFEIHPLQWKTKFTDNVYEGAPYILFQFFNKYQFVIEFIAPQKFYQNYQRDILARNDIYYESILDKAYGQWSYKERKQLKMTIKEVYENNQWRSFKEHSNDYEVLTCVPYLTKKGHSEIVFNC